ncbi:tail fiber assembly protein [Enterobacter roggenkampii]
MIELSEYVWSAKNNAFFPVAALAEYELNGWDLSDAIDVETSLFVEFTRFNPGKHRIVGNDGLPAWEDDLPLTVDELIAQAAAKKNSLLSKAAAKISILQDDVDLDMATEQEATALIAWKKYRVLLNRIDTAAPVIEWPTPPDAQAS